MGQCIITRKGGDSLDLSTITNWAAYKGTHPTNGTVIDNWYQGSHATFPITKLCFIHFRPNDTSSASVFAIINNGKLIALIGNDTQFITLSVSGNTITLTSNPSIALQATIGTN